MHTMSGLPYMYGLLDFLPVTVWGVKFYFQCQ